MYYIIGYIIIHRRVRDNTNNIMYLDNVYEIFMTIKRRLFFFFFSGSMFNVILLIIIISIFLIK